MKIFFLIYFLFESVKFVFSAECSYEGYCQIISDLTTPLAGNTLATTDSIVLDGYDGTTLLYSNTVKKLPSKYGKLCYLQVALRNMLRIVLADHCLLCILPD